MTGLPSLIAHCECCRLVLSRNMCLHTWTRSISDCIKEKMHHVINYFRRLNYENAPCWGWFALSWRFGCHAQTFSGQVCHPALGRTSGSFCASSLPRKSNGNYPRLKSSIAFICSQLRVQLIELNVLCPSKFTVFFHLIAQCCSGSLLSSISRISVFITSITLFFQRNYRNVNRVLTLNLLHSLWRTPQTSLRREWSGSDLQIHVPDRSKRSLLIVWWSSCFQLLMIGHYAIWKITLQKRRVRST